jgi:DNA-binding SARP family transcriptional activator/Tfp pilus assembly protein PilF
MQLRILGPVELRRDGQLVPVAPKQRVVLAALGLRANQVAPAEWLVTQLWGEQPPATATKTLHSLVLRLRRVLPAGMLMTRPPGYLLQVTPEQLDLLAFRQLAQDATVAAGCGEFGRAAESWRQALALWRGPALADVDSEWLRRDEVAGLEELRLAALEACIDAELRCGRHAGLVAELRRLVAAQPLRERLWAQLMVALYRAGRRADALATYRDARKLLVDELGVGPGRALQQLERQILVDDPVLDLPAVPASGSPAAAPTVVVPRQLPADVTSFTGRQPELAQLDRLVGSDQAAATTAVVVSAIAGTAGVGKTALAMHWAHRVADRFPDGQLYVDLRGYAPIPPLRPIQALAQFLHALGVAAEQVPVEVEEAAGLYRSLLADRRLLVVLDNAHNPDQVRPLLPASPGCLVLVTSRDRLAGLVAMQGARRLTLDVLTPADAHTLLARILGEQRVAVAPQATVALTQACALLPLALRIAAANLTNQPQRSIASYVAELGEATGSRPWRSSATSRPQYAPPFDLSYTLLDPEARRLFGLLGMVPGPDVTAEAAAALTDATVPQTALLLDRLAGAHLLGQHAPGRYVFHDLLRLYAAERACRDASEHDRSAATGRLYDWYLHAVDAAARLLYPEKLRLPLPPTETKRPSATFDDHARALTWLDAERPNLVAIVSHAAEHGPRPVAWLLADALRGYCWLRMHTVDWLAVAHAALTAAEADGDLRAQAAAQLSIADAHERQSQSHRAIDHYTRALILNRQTRWPEGQIAVLGNLGNAYWRSGRLQEAADHYTQALTIARQTGWLAGQAVRLGNLGIVYHDLGRLQQAADHYTQALALDRELGSRGAEAHDLENLGETYHALGQLDLALEQLTRALSLHREVGDRYGEAETLRILAEVHRDAGRHPHARELAQTALTLARETGHRRHEADALNALGTVHQRLAKPAQAIEYHQQALRLAREIETRYPEAVALIGLAAAHQHLGRHDQALACAHDAVDLTRQAGFRILEGRALANLASIYLDQAHLDQAADHIKHALDLHRDTGHRLGQARALLLLGHALGRSGDTRAAERRWQQALALFTEIGSPDATYVRTLLQTDSAPSGPQT